MKNLKNDHVLEIPEYECLGSYIYQTYPDITELIHSHIA